MEFSAQQIADLLKGQIVGDANAAVSGLSKIEEGKPGTLSFLANPKYEEHIYSTMSTIVIVNSDFTPQGALPNGCTLIKVPDAYSAFARLLEMYDQAVKKPPQIEDMSFVSPTAKLGKDVYIGAFAYIGEGVEIADNVQVYPNSYIGDNVKIGEGTI